MAVSSQTKGSIVEQLVWCEHRISELEEFLDEAVFLLSVDKNDRLTGSWESRRDALLKFLEYKE